MLEIKYYLLHVLISILWVLSLHKQSAKTFYQSAKVDLIVSWNESEKSWKHFRYVKLQVHGKIETSGKTRATQKIKYTEYIQVINVARM